VRLSHKQKQTHKTYTAGIIYDCFLVKQPVSKTQKSPNAQATTTYVISLVHRAKRCGKVEPFGVQLH